MSNHNTAELGIKATRKEIERLGGVNIVEHKEGHLRFITFVSPNGNSYKVVTRARKSGTWQTMATYGEQRRENPLESEYWVFVDLGNNPARFYPIPFWWISNDIYEVHHEYLERHGGHRKYNDNSVHHAVSLTRIKSWEGRWDKLGLQDM